MKGEKQREQPAPWRVLAILHCSRDSDFITDMRTNGDRLHGVALHVKGRSQVGGNVHRALVGLVDTFGVRWLQKRFGGPAEAKEL